MHAVPCFVIQELVDSLDTVWDKLNIPREFDETVHETFVPAEKASRFEWVARQVSEHATFDPAHMSNRAAEVLLAQQSLVNGGGLMNGPQPIASFA